MQKIYRDFKILSVLMIALLLYSGARANSAAGQATLSGYIREASSGEELIGANIVVEDLNTGATSNVYGFYSLTLPQGQYTVSFMYIGYETLQKQIDLTKNVNLNVALSESYLEMETIITTATRADENVRSIEMSVAKLDVQAIRRVPAVLGEVDVIKTIQLLPGVSSVGEGSTSFNVRGGSSDQNLVLLDESPIYNAAHLFGFFSVFNADATKDVKLYKAGIPANYGGRLSSVLDVRQREGNNQAFKASGGLGLIFSRLTLEGPIQRGKSSFIIAGRRSYGDIFLPLFNNNSTAYFYDLNFKANYIASDRNRIFLSAYFGRDRFAIDDVFGNGWGNAAFTLRWNHLFSDRLFSNLSAIYSRYDYQLNILADGSAFTWNSNIKNAHLKYDLTYFWNDKNTIDFGLGLIDYQFAPGRIDPLKNSAVTSRSLNEKYALEPSAYINYDQKINQRLSLQYGLRFSSFLRTGQQTIYSYINDTPILYNENLGIYQRGLISDSTYYRSNEIIKSFFGIEPRFSMRYAITEEQSVKFSYNRTRQYIHLISNTASPSPVDVWTPSGKYIQPQVADQFALGYFRNFIENTYETSVEVYYKALQNQLDYIPGANLVINNTLETEILRGSGRAYGIELYAKKRSGALNGWISYTLSRSERLVKGINPLDPGINKGRYYPSSFDKTHDLSISGTYDLNKHWSFSSNFIYTSGRPVNFPESRYEFAHLVIAHYDGRNQERLPAYHRLDISATLHNKWRGDWVFSLYNVYNRMNATSITFRQNADNPRITEAVRTTIFGIVPSITYNFKF